LVPRDRNLGVRTSDRCAERREDALRVIPCRGGFDDDRLPIGGEPGEEDRALDLCGRDVEPMPDPAQRSPGDDDRSVAVGRVDRRAHPPER
jgi:hypothetical protein